MNDCPNADVRDLLPDLVHDRLAAGTRAEVESHVATCVDCQEEVALLRDLRASMRRTPIVDVSAIAMAVPAYRAPARRRSWVGWQAAAAITILAVGGTSAIVLRSHTILPIDTASVVLSGREAPSPTSVPVSRQVTPPSPASTSGATSETPSRVQPQSPPATTVASATPPQRPAQAPVARERELAMAGGTMNELSDDELTKLLKDIDKMDAIPSTDVESGATTPRVPARIDP